MPYILKMLTHIMITAIQFIQTSYEKLSFDQISCNIEGIKHLNKAKCVQYNYLENTILWHIYVKKTPEWCTWKISHSKMCCKDSKSLKSNSYQLSLYFVFPCHKCICLRTYLIRVKTRLIKNIENSNVLSSTNIFSLSIQNLTYLNGLW